MSTTPSTDSCRSGRVETEALRDVSATINEIQKIQRRLDGACVKSRHQIGQLLIRDRIQIETAIRMCITRKLEFWETFAQSVGLHTRTLRDCLKFAEEYEASEVERLVKRGVTWTHVVHLLSLRTDEERDNFLNRVITEGLTAAELQKEIMEKYGNRRPGSGMQAKKSQPKPPNSLKVGLKRANQLVDRLNAEHEHALFCDQFYLPAEIENEAPDHITQETADDVDHLIEKYRMLQNDIPGILNELAQARRRIDGVFEERKRQAERLDEAVST